MKLKEQYCMGFILTLLALPVVAQQTESTDTSSEATINEKDSVEEIVVTETDPDDKFIVRPGWRPSSPAEAQEHIENAFTAIQELDTLAMRCDLDAITTYADATQYSNCERFLKRFDTRVFVNRNIQCEGLIAWYQNLVDEYTKDPNWATKDDKVIAWMAMTKQNLVMTCDLRSIEEHFRYLTAARKDIQEIRFYVENGRTAPMGLGGFAPIVNLRPDENGE